MQRRKEETMEIKFQYFDSCPNWHLTHDRLAEVLKNRDDVKIVMQQVETAEEAAATEFRGSPTVLVDGVDPFVDSITPPAGTLACRVYQTEDGSPTVEQLRDAVSR
jgi:hypothetical protein